ncbi:hypothetical protein PANA5342_3822 [Pantoea ananatis LMG 5342]|nr:hypothetical protein PANA5342_3822 [Pantoea ananatis LMG 5342]
MITPTCVDTQVFFARNKLNDNELIHSFPVFLPVL